MAFCLLATARTSNYRVLGYGNISQYAERALHLSGRKARALLGTARALEHLPLLSRAFEEGKLGWAKLRAIQSLVTPTTEKLWLEFAMSHRADQVVSKVTMSPAAWKKHMALQASLSGQPIATPEAVEELLAEPVGDPPPDKRNDAECGLSPEVESDKSARGEGSSTQPSLDGISRGSDSADSGPELLGHLDTDLKLERPALPPLSIPKTLRLTFELTPDQYALYERAEGRLRAQSGGKRLARAQVLALMAELVLDVGVSRSRAKHQVLIHKSEESGQGWYDTDRGPLPVSAAVMAEVEGSSSSLDLERQISASSGVESEQACASSCRGSGAIESCPSRSRRRVDVPAATLRALFARASHRCERCGCTGPLQVHHQLPVSEGGGNDLEFLAALCPGCHGLGHESDFASKPSWSNARERRRSGRSREPDL